MAVIYKITNMVNGKYYIGSAESFERRKWQHIYDLKRVAHKNPKLQASWNKHGADAFVFEVIEQIPEGRSAFDIENTYLHKCVGQPDCYNINTDAIGMRTGIPHTEEAKAKQSAKVQAALAEGRAGKFIPDEETRAKMSTSAKGNQNAKGYKRTDAEREAIRRRTLGNKHFAGKQHTEETKEKMRKPVYALLPDRSVRTFSGLSVLRDEMGVSLMTIIRACTSGNPIKCGVLAGWVLSYQQVIPAPVIPEQYKELPRTRQEAKEKGVDRYFTGVPCGRGHVFERSTKGVCIACRREDDTVRNTMLAARKKP